MAFSDLIAQLLQRGGQMAPSAPSMNSAEPGGFAGTQLPQMAPGTIPVGPTGQLATPAPAGGPPPAMAYGQPPSNAGYAQMAQPGQAPNPAMQNLAQATLASGIAAAPAMARSILPVGAPAGGGPVTAADMAAKFRAGQMRRPMGQPGQMPRRQGSPMRLGMGTPVGGDTLHDSDNDGY